MRNELSAIEIHKIKNLEKYKAAAKIIKRNKMMTMSNDTYRELLQQSYEKTISEKDLIALVKEVCRRTNEGIKSRKDDDN